MVRKRKHPIAVIDKAIGYALQNKWRLKVKKRGHAWGQLYCPGEEHGACIASVWSTPRVPENHAKQIKRKVDNCEHNA